MLLHGGTGSWMHWVRNIEDLSRDFMLLVPDIPGSGESAAPHMPTSVEKVAEALLAGIDQILGSNRTFSHCRILHGRVHLGLRRKARRRARDVSGAGRPGRHHRAA